MAVVEHAEFDRGDAPAEPALRFERELDAAPVRSVRTAVADALAGTGDVRVDLSTLPHLSPLGIRELLRAEALAAQQGRAFVVVNPSLSVRRSLNAADAGGLLARDA